jgi:hypothetical protein
MKPIKMASDSMLNSTAEASHSASFLHLVNGIEDECRLLFFKWSSCGWTPHHRESAYTL